MGMVDGDSLGVVDRTSDRADNRGGGGSACTVDGTGDGTGDRDSSASTARE